MHTTSIQSIIKIFRVAAECCLDILHLWRKFAQYVETDDLEDAVERAAEECICEDILAEFLEEFAPEYDVQEICKVL